MNLERPGKASVIILTRNGLEYTRQCLDSIFAKTSYPDYEIIIVDNASQDGTIDYLEEISTQYSSVHILLNKQNQGFARGNNQGASTATGEYLVFLNNDVVVTHGWLTRLIGCLQDSSIGMIGPVTNSASNEAKVRVTYDSIEDLDRFANEYTQSHEGESFEIRTLAFFCVALRTERFNEIGPLDERFGLGMFEDDDYAVRVKNAGYKVVCAEDVYVHHWGGASFLKLDPYQYWLLFKENRRKFEEKWNTRWQPHIQRTELLPDQVIQLNERVYQLQWQLLAESQQVHTDQSFDIVTQRLIEQEQKIDDLSSTLQEIYSSNAWKVVQSIWKTRRTLIPEGSQRKALFDTYISKTDTTGLGDSTTRQKPKESQFAGRSEVKQGAQLHVEINTQQVPILAPQFFDLEGGSVFLGGAERYLIELVKLLRELDRDPIVFQSAAGEWQREYEGVPFFGLNTGGDNRKLNVLFHNLIEENAPVIYLAFNLAAPYHSSRSVGISHGIFWDTDFQDKFADRSLAIDFLIKSFSNLAHIVSVDTNTINWLRTVQPALAEKCSYIPNFVDLDQFKPGDRTHDEKIVVLYPRRLYTRRGFWMVYKLVPEFLDKFPRLQFQFVGQADPEEQSAVEGLIREHQGKVEWQVLELMDMHTAYQQADITLIPSLHSEGTSLSCLEAMACGNAVITTNVGGLPDLVISGYNGLLIEPDVGALRDALILLCENLQLRSKFGKRGREVAENFNLGVWREKWRKVLSEVLL